MELHPANLLSQNPWATALQLGLVNGSMGWGLESKKESPSVEPQEGQPRLSLCKKPLPVSFTSTQGFAITAPFPNFLLPLLYQLVLQALCNQPSAEGPLLVTPRLTSAFFCQQLIRKSPLVLLSPHFSENTVCLFVCFIHMSNTLSAPLSFYFPAQGKLLFSLPKINFPVYFP